MKFILAIVTDQDSPDEPKAQIECNWESIPRGGEYITVSSGEFLGAYVVTNLYWELLSGTVTVFARQIG